MNPLTAVRLMLETVGEGQRKRAFGFDYREKAALEQERLLGERAEREQRAALFPDTAKVGRLAAAKAEAEQLERIAYGGDGTEAGAANARARVTKEKEERDARFEDVRIANEKVQLEGNRAKIPGQEVPGLSDATVRRMRGMKPGDTGPPQPITNTELPILQDLSDDAARERQNQATNALYREGFRGGSGRGGLGGIGGAANTPEAVLDIAGRAIMSLSKPRQAAAWNEVNRYMKAGRVDDVKSVIRQIAVEGELADDKRLINGRYRMVRGLIDIKTTLLDMQARGVPTGVLTGSGEDVLRKAGMTGNPEYVRLATRLNDMLITYRRASTGVAFGEKEGKQYEALMPNYYNIPVVNFAQIDGLLQAMGSYDRSFWVSKLGDQGAIFAGAIEDVPGDENTGGTAAMAASRALRPAPTPSPSPTPPPGPAEERPIDLGMPGGWPPDPAPIDEGMSAGWPPKKGDTKRLRDGRVATWDGKGWWVD